MRKNHAAAFWGLQELEALWYLNLLDLSCYLFICLCLTSLIIPCIVHFPLSDLTKKLGQLRLFCSTLHGVLMAFKSICISSTSAFCMFYVILYHFTFQKKMHYIHHVWTAIPAVYETYDFSSDFSCVKISALSGIPLACWVLVPHNDIWDSLIQLATQKNAKKLPNMLVILISINPLKVVTVHFSSDFCCWNLPAPLIPEVALVLFPPQKEDLSWAQTTI